MIDVSRGTVLIANPSADVYGSDLQMLQSVNGLVSCGWRVVVAIPQDGPLVPMLRGVGAEVKFVEFPVLRRANASLLPFVSMVVSALRALPRMRRALRQAEPPTVLYVNTVTLPWWLLVGRLTRVPVVCHVHEAETEDRWLIRTALTLPLLLASATLVISRSTMDAMCDVLPLLRHRAHLLYNGVPGPPTEPESPTRTRPNRLVVVGRLSPRKGPHIALEAVAKLRAEGRQVELEVCGSAFEGYEWYVAELENRARRADLAGAVTFAGYTSPVWPALARADIVLAPSVREPFGNAVVEAQLAMRPVVATGAQGHLESIADGETGLLVPPGDVEAMSRAVATLLDDETGAARIAAEARRRALELFSVDRYVREVDEIICSLVAAR